MPRAFHLRSLHGTMRLRRMLDPVGFPDDAAAVGTAADFVILFYVTLYPCGIVIVGFRLDKSIGSRP